MCIRDRLETEVTRKVEDAVATLNHVKRVFSTVVDGQSTTVVEFRIDANLLEALNDAKDAVSRIRMDLPLSLIHI